MISDVYEKYLNVSAEYGKCYKKNSHCEMSFIYCSSGHDQKMEKTLELQCTKTKVLTQAVTLPTYRKVINFC